MADQEAGEPGLGLALAVQRIQDVPDQGPTGLLFFLGLVDPVEGEFHALLLDLVVLLDLLQVAQAIPDFLSDRLFTEVPAAQDLSKEMMLLR